MNVRHVCALVSDGAVAYGWIRWAVSRDQRRSLKVRENPEPLRKVLVRALELKGCERKASLLRHGFEITYESEDSPDAG